MLEDVEREAMCSHCLANGVYYPQASRYSPADLIARFSEGAQTVTCQKLIPIRIDYIAPDISLKQLPVIPASKIDIEKEIGRGGIVLFVRLEMQIFFAFPTRQSSFTRAIH